MSLIRGGRGSLCEAAYFLVEASILIEFKWGLAWPLLQTQTSMLNRSVVVCCVVVEMGVRVTTAELPKWEHNGFEAAG